jgi:hypothetical protein
VRLTDDFGIKIDSFSFFRNFETIILVVLLLLLLLSIGDNLQEKTFGDLWEEGVPAMLSSSTNHS